MQGLRSALHQGLSPFQLFLPRRPSSPNDAVKEVGAKCNSTHFAPLLFIFFKNVILLKLTGNAGLPFSSGGKRKEKCSTISDFRLYLLFQLFLSFWASVFCVMLSSLISRRVRKSRRGKSLLMTQPIRTAGTREVPRGMEEPGVQKFSCNFVFLRDVS